MKIFLAALLAAVAVAACAGSPGRRGGTEGAAGKAAAHPADEGEAREMLYRQYREWKGVPYRSGGMTREGLDCSALVFLTFRDRFGIVLPRSTKSQVRSGKRIRRNALRPGDLVFFKTGFFSRHVGIYVGQRTFLHVSVKEGVTMSSLDSGYWSKKYWQSRRLLPG